MRNAYTIFGDCALQLFRGSGTDRNPSIAKVVLSGL